MPKNISILINYVAGPLLFCWLAHRIYVALITTPHLKQSWEGISQSVTGYRFFYLPLVILLMLANWSLEAAKWKKAVQDIQPISFFTSFKAVLTGLSFAVTTPNRVGEYVGRMLYLPAAKRVQILSLTLVCSFAQILVTAWAGSFAFLYLKTRLLNAGLLKPTFAAFIPVILFAGSALLTLIYFLLPQLEKNLERKIRWPAYQRLVQAVGSISFKIQFSLFVLSALRYAVFLVQYFLLFRLFEVFVPVQYLAAVTALQFLVLAIVPTVALAELGLRGELSLQLLGLFSTNAVGAVLTSVTMWVINLIVPAVAGSLLLMTIKFFRKNDHSSKLHAIERSEV